MARSDEALKLLDRHERCIVQREAVHGFGVFLARELEKGGGGDQAACSCRSAALPTGN